jgi:hypothetical protein
LAHHERWYGGAIVRERTRSRASRASRGGGIGIACLGVAAVLAGCGGGAKQDASEKAHTYDLHLTAANFLPSQAIARPVTLELAVENAGKETVPDIATTLTSLSYASDYADLAARQRPIWVIERGPGPPTKTPVNTQEVSIPGGAQTSNVNTWALGALPPGHVAKFVWHLVPVKAGHQEVKFFITPSLGPKAAGMLHAAFEVDIAGAPPGTYVNPKTGKVERGTYPASK